MAATIEFIARIRDEKTGKIIEKKVDVGDLPGMEEFDLETGRGFLETFDRYEKGLLEARNKAGEMVTEEFFGSLGKKKVKAGEPLIDSLQNADSSPCS